MPLKLSGMNDVFISNGQLYAVGNGGIAVQYDGNQWNQLHIGTTKNLNSVWGYDDGGQVAFYAVGQAGKIMQLKKG
jgi:uncharacterized membrane protein